LRDNLKVYIFITSKDINYFVSIENKSHVENLVEKPLEIISPKSNFLLPLRTLYI